MKNLLQVREEIARVHAEAEAIVNVAKAENRDTTAEETARIDEILGAGDKPGLLDGLRQQEARALKIENAMAESLARRQPTGEPKVEGNGSTSPRIQIAASVRRPAVLNLGKGVMSRVEQEEAAYRFGQFIMATRFGKEENRRWCREHGVEIVDAASEGWDSNLGVLVPTETETSIIRLVNEYGVARRVCEDVPMMSDTKNSPRRTSGLTTYYVGEGTAPTESNIAADNVMLVAKILAALGKYSGSLNEDSLISIGDLYAQELALAFAKAEDDALFLGDGTSTYGRIVGLKNALTTGSQYTSATGHTSYATLTLADFVGMTGLVQSYGFSDARWYIHRSGWAASMQGLAAAAGGNLVAQIVGGVPQNTFLGYPVEFVESMNNTLTAQTSTVGLCYFGSMKRCVKFGSRRRLAIKASDQVYFTTDQLAVLALERFDINVHDVGVTGGASGGIVVLKTASS